MAKDILEIDETTGFVKLPSKAQRLAKLRREDQKKEREARHARLADVEDILLDKAAALVDYASRYADLTPEMTGPPDEWVDELGKEEADKAFRVAQSAWTNKKDAPIGLQMAHATVMGILKNKVARGTIDATPTLNVQVVQLTQEAPRVYPKLEVEK